jgi:hypothetical protein
MSPQRDDILELEEQMKKLWNERKHLSARLEEAIRRSVEVK